MFNLRQCRYLKWIAPLWNQSKVGSREHIPQGLYTTEKSIGWLIFQAWYKFLVALKTI